VEVASVWCQLNGSVWVGTTTANGWTNWSVDVSLLPGTNVVRTYAVDAAGNTSTTNSVSLVYVVSDRLLVQAIGQGTLAPNYSNAVLEIGRGYSMKATGVNGHTFANWVVATNWSGGVTSTNPTLSFVMRSNLTVQAIFADTTRPTLTVAAPAANQRWSNAVFTVRGTARDNAGVTNVWCQVSGGVWAGATTGNIWTNWAVDVPLLPGTNVVKAYAVDAAGNTSITNSVSLIYVLSDRLLVRAIGQGTLAPNYSNAVLEIGRGYSMKATGINGHTFANWIVATNWTGGVTSTNPTLGFVMRSNLTVRAIFADTTRPTLTVAAPTANQRWSNAVFTVRGTAKDNAGVTNVWCQPSGGDWASATTGNGWTNWAIEVALTPGTNLVKAYAVDAAGTRSPTNSVSLVYVVSDRLVVQATGPCTMSPNYSNAVLEIGKAYSTTVTPGKGYVLSNWVGSVPGSPDLVSSAAKVTFSMGSNLVLQANISPNPFSPVKGTYNGLFAGGERTHDSSGFFTLTLTENGSYSASLKCGNSSYPFTGQFDAAGRDARVVTRPGANAWGIMLSLDFAARGCGAR
jgi:hypothetical protein